MEYISFADKRGGCGCGCSYGGCTVHCDVMWCSGEYVVWEREKKTMGRGVGSKLVMVCELLIWW